VTAPNPQIDSDREVAQEAAAELRAVADKIAGSVAETAVTVTAVSVQPAPAGARQSPALTAMAALMSQLPEATADTATSVHTAADELEAEASVLANTDQGGAGGVRKQGEGK